MGYSNAVKKAVAIKEAFMDAVDTHKGNYVDWITRIAVNNPAKALELHLRMAEYFLPKLKSEELNVFFQAPKLNLSKLDDDELETLKRLYAKCQTPTTS